MLVKLYGMMDLAAGILMLLLKWGIGKYLAFILASYLVIKSLFYLKDMASILDLLAGIAMFAAAFGFYHLLFCIFALWLLQKGFFSIFS